MTRIEDLTTRPNCEDRFAIWPIALCFGFPALLVLLWSGPFVLAFSGAPFLLMVWISAVLVAVAMAVPLARARLWRRALSFSILPLVALVEIANASTAWSLAIETGERLHFQVMRRSYLAEVLKLPSGEPRFAVWEWGGFVVGHGVVYDESDEILLPKHSPAWKKRVANTTVGMCGAWGTSLGNHFYLVRIGC